MLMRIAALVTCVTCGVLALGSRADDDKSSGALPADDQGRRLNLDFESGTLADWTATGDAFRRQPVRGDTVHARRADMRSNHAGDFWVGTYETDGDGPRGSLTSAPFKVTRPWAAFLVGGGAYDQTRVEIVGADDQRVLFSASGQNGEDMRRVAVDLRAVQGKRIFIRIIDELSGPWGHINFDDFRFYEARPDDAVDQALQPGAVQHAGLTPEEAVKAIKLPDGFRATVFAAEPDVNQPVGFAIDDCGRLWVAEAWTYPIRQPEGQGKDRILIFEDTDGDGRADKRTVFIEGLNLVSGIELGFGGVWVGAAPYLMFIPDRDRDDKPDGAPEILLDGWAYQDTHETLNAFNWGPDGWLYGCHGVFTHSRVGKPGTPDGQRVPLNAAIWRYHPTRHEFEVFAEGTSNPWGVDFDDRGQAFATACVIPHLFHIIQGGRYRRQAGQHFNAHTYDDIKACADHVHWRGAQPHAGNNKSDTAGGGHAHCGAMIYLGDSFPPQYRNTIFMGNIHGNRINNDKLDPHGSGFIGKHAPDFMLMNDKWSRLINFKYGPDGSVYVIDWYDKQACHHTDPNIWDRTNGRIYKITYSNSTPGQSGVRAAPPRIDLAKLSDDELIKLQLHPNDWYVRHARRILQERAPGAPVAQQLKQMLSGQKEPTRTLRAMWALHAIGALSDDVIDELLKAHDPYVRAWTVQLATERFGPMNLTNPPRLDFSSVRQDVAVPSRNMQLAESLAARARAEPSPVVRLALASALQRMEYVDRWPVLEALIARAEDATDPNIPLMIWYAAEPAVASDVEKGLALARATKIPILRRFIARRVASVALAGNAAPLNGLAALLRDARDESLQLDVLSGMADAFRGQSRVSPPVEWEAVHETLSRSANADVRQLVQAISTTFGNERALDGLRRQILDESARPADRLQAVESLVAARDPKLPPLLKMMLGDAALRSSAVRGIAAFDDVDAAAALVSAYKGLDAPTKTEALNTLASRAAFARLLKDAVESNAVPRDDLTAAVLRQLHSLNDDAINAWIGSALGMVRRSPREKLVEMQRWRDVLQPAALDQADPTRGRAVFARTCMQCHTLFDAGGKTGPDLTGSDRANVNYILENVIDPSAVVGKQYLTTVVAMKDGRVLAGVAKAQDENAVTLVTETETLVLPRPQIQRAKTTELSMMPEGLLAGLKEDDVRDLVAYLRSPRQVPMLATPQNVASLFNDKDLTGWSGDHALWTVENGEIVGRSAGLERNAFLVSQLAAGNFKLKIEVKLVGDQGNSGLQFRSEPIDNGADVKGYQADIGPGWWGKLYEEHGRGVLSDKSGESFVRPGEWNSYEIVATGSRIVTKINGQVCADLDDPNGAKRGVFALQLHSGGPTEVRFRNIKLEVHPPDAR